MLQWKKEQKRNEPTGYCRNDRGYLWLWNLSRNDITNYGLRFRWAGWLAEQTSEKDLHVFIRWLYVTIRKEYESKNYAVYTILGYDTDGEKDILGLWLNESESKHTWMQIFDELKTRGVEDVLFISMDGVSGLEEGAKAIFKDVEQLFAYGSAVRKVMYTTNAVESINLPFLLK